jgi:hypothetical protein
MAVLRALSVLAALFLTGLIIWAFGRASFWASFAAISADPWGVVTLVDLYLGFAIAGVVIALVERSWRAVLWIAATLVLGNVVTALWLAWRLPRLAAALGSGPMKMRV